MILAIDLHGHESTQEVRSPAELASALVQAILLATKQGRKLDSLTLVALRDGEPAYVTWPYLDPAEVNDFSQVIWERLQTQNPATVLVAEVPY